MTARVRRLDLTTAERRTAERTNAALALIPRLKADGWRLTAEIGRASCRERV